MRSRTLVGRTLLCVCWLLTNGCASTPQAATHGDAPPNTCLRQAPTQCVATAPDYARDVEPILRSRCFGCHTKDGQAAEDHDFSTAASVFAQRHSLQRQVAACAMPPRGARPLTPGEANTLLQWVACARAPSGSEAKVAQHNPN